MINTLTYYVIRRVDADGTALYRAKTGRQGFPWRSHIGMARQFATMPQAMGEVVHNIGSGQADCEIVKVTAAYTITTL